MFVAALFWFTLALMMAAVEIETEGKHGWAEKAPTWYRTTGPLGIIWELIMNGKPLTGYHFFMFFFVLLMFHLSFVMGVEWSAVAELKTLAIYFCWCCFWDFLWFVLNPYYGIENFQKTKVWWHHKSYWIFGLFPVDYANGVGLSILLTGITWWLTKEVSVLSNHIRLLCWLSFFTFVSNFTIAPLYKAWYRLMRQRDDRDKAGIFHTVE